MKIKFTSFFTPRYEKQATRLCASLDKHGLDFDVVDLPEEFSEEPGEKFLKAVRFKPSFIHMQVEKYYDNYDAVVWLDADAEVVKPPKLLYMIDADAGVYYREVFELVANTMFWRCCPKVLAFLDRWAQTMDNEQVQALPCPEQQVLQDIIVESGLIIRRLPEEYAYMRDFDQKQRPGATIRERNNMGRVVEPVILQHQASREMRTT